VPLLVAPCSEACGRLPVYHIGNVLFIVFTVTCAVNGKLNMLIGFRFLQGVAGPTPITIGDRTIADLFVQEQRGGALAVWSMGHADRQVVGPITVAIDSYVDRE
jgi:MFS family permease